MRTLALLAMITVSEATIGVFVKLVDGRIPIATLNFFALAFAAAFLLVTVPRATGRPLDFPTDNLRDTLIIGALIALQISVFNYAMTLAPIANVVIFWSVAPFFSFLFAWAFLGERPRRSYIAIFVLALVGIVIAKPLAGGHVAGNLVALADAAIYAAMITYMRHEGRTETDNDVPWQMTVAALVLAPSLLLAGPGEPLLDALARHMPRAAQAADGQVLAFRLAPRARVKHLGISCDAGRAFIHACPRAGVVLAPLSAPWARRIVARFDFPPLFPGRPNC